LRGHERQAAEELEQGKTHGEERKTIDASQAAITLDMISVPGNSSRRWSGASEGPRRAYYRPQQDCIMFTRDEVGFCAVCRRAIERVIRMYAQ
jgi:IgA Peptidase M64